MLDYEQSGLGFTTVLNALEKAGLVSRQCRQRLDSTRMFGRVARMSRLDCVRESLRLALQEVEAATSAEERPAFWIGLWERYVESQVDYRASGETLARKLGEAGTDAWQLLQWLGEAGQAQRAAGPQAQLLRRVLGEQFEVGAGQPAALEKEKAVVAEATVEAVAGAEGVAPSPVSESPNASAAVGAEPASAPAVPKGQAEFSAEAMKGIVHVEPKGKGQLSSGRVQNPHEPEATYAAKGQGLGKDQRHRSLVVGEHHSALRARRQEQKTEAFQQRMRHRNGIEGTQSELVRGHGLRHARYRGLAKVKLQNYFVGAACNVKRWIRREAWQRAQAVSGGAAEAATAAAA